MLSVVERVAVGGLGGDSAAAIVRSRRPRQEKAPWNTLDGLHGAVESEFLRPLFLGESIAPFRATSPELAVIPWDQDVGMLDSRAAQALGRPRLAAWLGNAERLWNGHGTGKMTLSERWTFQRGITNQFPVAPLRVVYAASGTIPAACILRGLSGVVEHKLYWAAFTDEAEARYLIAILNSETARARIAGMQSKGQWGARDFDKLMFELPIPKFDAAEPIHVELAEQAVEAEAIAAKVDVDGLGFVAARGRIRDALRTNGVGGQIEALVVRLLGEL
jgi:hypothetical protein